MKIYNPSLKYLQKITSTRTLNSAGFQPSVSNLVFVEYSVRIQGTITLAGGAAGLVQLMIDSNATPTTVETQGRNGLTGTLIVGVTINGDGSVNLTGWVNPGEFARIVTTNATGAPTFTLEQQKETWF